MKAESFTTIRSVGGLLPADTLARAAEGRDLPGLAPTDYHLIDGETVRTAANRAWTRLTTAWTSFRTALEASPEADVATGLTRDKWLHVLFTELGYGRLATTPAGGIVADATTYPVSHIWGAVPIHFVGARIPLDRRTRGVAGAATRAPHSMLQELLNRSEEHLWGIVSNGHQLRLLRDNASLVRDAYVEFDLEAMFDGEIFSDFVVLYLVCHQSRLEADPITECWLERWRTEAVATGTRALDALRDGVTEALRTLGTGFLRHPDNAKLRQALADATLDKQDYYRALLRLVYRLLFAFVAEDRDLLLQQGNDASVLQARRRYSDFFSTTKLRSLATRRRGTRHGDLWHALRVVFDALGSDNGCAELALPALGGLFDPDTLGILEHSSLSNEALLGAVRSLSQVTQNGITRAIDFRNLGAEELGSVYESLLELAPQHDPATGDFGLTTLAGSERKTTGSYYTPTSLINRLLDSALEPVLVSAEGRDDPASALLALTICDPACGSGHFLVAAARRVARHLATVRTGEKEPTPAATRSALREVVGRCIFGVDLNPLAAELAKVSLWLEALEPGKPLNFLDAQIKVGNALLGATPALVESGIPDRAFNPALGDTKKVSSSLKKRNHMERSETPHGMQLQLGERAVGPQDTLATTAAAVRAHRDDSVTELRARERLFRDFVTSPVYSEAKLVADAWCAAFMQLQVADAPHVTEGVFRRLAEHPNAVSTDVREAISQLASRYQFFQWHLEFPDVFHPGSPATNGKPGFDVMIGNPPWEKFTVSDEEWFAARDPEIANTKGKSKRDQLIKALRERNAALDAAYQSAKRDQDLFAKVLSRDAGTYPLTGFKELNTYHLFAELADRLLSSEGRAGLIVKTGIGAAENCVPFFKKLTDGKQLVSLFDFVNKKALFPSVQTVERFSLLTFAGIRGHSEPIRLATLCQDPLDIDKPGRSYHLSPEDIALMSPVNGACPLLKSEVDAEIMRRLYRAHPLISQSDSSRPDEYWNIQYVPMFHMANDSKYFRRLEEFQELGLKPRPDRIFIEHDEEYLPLYEGKYLFHLDHRYGSFEGVPPAKKYGRKATAPKPTESQLRDPSYEVLPRYWFPKSRWLERAKNKGLRTDFQFLFRDVAGAYPDLRTAIGAIVPAGPAGDKAPTLALASTADEDRDIRRLLALAALFVSLPFDYCVRNKLFSKSLKMNTLGQIPMPRPEVVVPRASENGTFRSALILAALELACTTYSLQPLASELGSKNPFIWDSDRRFMLLREVDALAAHFFGLTRNEFEHVLSTFETLQDHEQRIYGEYKTRAVALRAFDRILESDQTGRAYRPLLDPPPADSASSKHEGSTFLGSSSKGDER